MDRRHGTVRIKAGTKIPTARRLPGSFREPRANTNSQLAGEIEPSRICLQRYHTIAPKIHSVSQQNPYQNKFPAGPQHLFRYW